MPAWTERGAHGSCDRNRIREINRNDLLEVGGWTITLDTAAMRYPAGQEIVVVTMESPPDTDSFPGTIDSCPRIPKHDHLGLVLGRCRLLYVETETLMKSAVFTTIEK